MVESRWAMTSVVRFFDDLVERVLDLLLGVAVERAGRLVEDQDRRPFEDGAGDGDALLLAAGELEAALARPWCGSRRAARAMNASICAMRAASRTSSSLASGRP